MRVTTSASFSTDFVTLSCGVPQGSVLSPLLFSLYISDITTLAHHFDLDIHLFADDVLIYGHSSPSGTSSLSLSVSQCLDQVDTYLKSLRLLLNPDKTKIM